MKKLISIMIHHKVAANLLMIALIIPGLFALKKINTQFLPNFKTDQILITIPWPNHSAQEIERSAVIPVEQEIKNIPDIKSIDTNCHKNFATILIECKEKSDINQILDDTKDQVNQVDNLPPTLEPIQIKRLAIYERIAKITLSGQYLDEIIPWGERFKQQLQTAGIAKIDIRGKPDNLLAISVPRSNLYRYRLTLSNIAAQIKGNNTNHEAGEIGKQSNAIPITNQGTLTNPLKLEKLPIQKGQQFITLAHLAHIHMTHPSDSTYGFSHQQPAVNLVLYRSQGMDALQAANIMQTWLQQAKKTLPSSMHLKVYQENWTMLKGRIDVLIKNGLGGLILVIALLCLFLNVRVACWIAAGIPISFTGALFILYMTNNTINMVSLFAFIMTLGIIVDDAIVVGEETASQFQQTKDHQAAAEKGATSMLKPVLSSSLTTLFAFLPLLTIGGIIGTILHDIPIVVICVLIASIIECFFILPGHLKHSLKNIKAPSKRRQKLNKAIDNLRYVHYRNALNYCVNNARFICCLFLSLLFMCCCLCFSGRLPFNFFPMPESNLIFLDATFVNGTPDKQKMEFIKASTQALKKAEQALVTKGDPLISHIMAFQGRGNYPKGENSQMVSLQVERINQAHPDIKNQKLIKIWKQYLRQPTYLTQLNISQPKSGPPGKEIHIAITGNEDIKILAKGVSNIKKALSGYAGLYNIEDDLSQGNQQWVYHLKPMAYQHHIDAAQIATQLQSQLVGSTAMRIYRNIGKIKIKVQLTNKNQLSLGDLKYLPIIASDGQAYYLNDLVTWDSQANYDHIQRYNLKRVAQVFAEVNPKINNANQIIQSLKENTLPALKKQYGLNMTFKGRAEDQEKTLGDMRIGVIIALLLIYITLAWISESYWWPCLLLSTIPFALVGALVGHWLLNMPVTLLSLFGFFGLSGIVLNDSIILLLRFKSMRHQYPNIKEAIIHAACLRFRAILLTSLTTIGGLFPLLFEQSVQAQFLIPMAITIIFGLIVSTLVILFLVPTLITLCPNTERPALLEKQPNPS